jgi:hypothetical protein
MRLTSLIDEFILLFSSLSNPIERIDPADVISSPRESFGASFRRNRRPALKKPPIRSSWILWNLCSGKSPFSRIRLRGESRRTCLRGCIFTGIILNRVLVHQSRLADDDDDVDGFEMTKRCLPFCVSPTADRFPVRISALSGRSILIGITK